MPIATALGTEIQAPAPPTIEIKVTNGGGGLGDPALVTVTVVWDPAVLSFGEVVAPMARFTVTNSSCTWTDYGIPWGGHRVFRVILYRKSGHEEETFVIATSTDARSGDSSPEAWAVPKNHPQEP